jgi:uncharacterized protein YuzE
MELWQLDIVDGIRLADGTETKIVTGVDDHSRFCVIAIVVRRATGRAVCSAFTEALREYGIPDEVLTDNGKQFTGRFTKPRPAEVMFERICRENGIVARNTKPRMRRPTRRPRAHATIRAGPCRTAHQQSRRARRCPATHPRRHGPCRPHRHRRDRRHHLPHLRRRRVAHRGRPHHHQTDRPVQGPQTRTAASAHRHERRCANLTTMHIQARIPLVCTYDSDADAAYIYFDHPIPADAAEQVVPFEPEHGMFNLDLNADGHVLGVEIVGARKHLPPALLRAILAHEDQTKNGR